MAKRIVILGAGESGTGAAVLAQKKDLKRLFPTLPSSRTNTSRCLTKGTSHGKKADTQRN